MRISVLGLGYVGAVCASCLSVRGHEVIDVDVSSTEIDLINQGKSPIVEPDLEALPQQDRQIGRLSGTANFKGVMLDSDVSFVCIGTPSRKSGDLDLSYIETVCREIDLTIREKSERRTVVVCGTVLPDAINNIVILLIKGCSGKKARADLGASINPEFLRKSTVIKNHDFPPVTVISELDKQTGDLLEEIYHELDAPIIRKTAEVAEIIKYTYNARHTAKVAFVNEISSIAKVVGVDGRKVMDTTCQGHKLNLLRYYMRPGFASGDSRLPRDVRTPTYRASQLDIEHPMLGPLMRSNSNQVQRAFDLITSRDTHKVSLLDLSFKVGTDDPRESPLAELAEMLIGRGYELRIFNRNVEYARVHRVSKEYVEPKIPHVSSLLVSDLDEVVASSDMLVLGSGDELFADLVNKTPSGRKLIDLVGFMPHAITVQAESTCRQRVAPSPANR